MQNIAKKKKIKTLSIGNDNSNLKIVNKYFFNNKQQISIIFNNIKYSFETKIIGKIQIKNLLMAILAASKIIPMKKIIQSINKIQSVNGRLEKIGVIKNNSKVILDYAHTPQGLKICI